jgi:hypothetical protein
MYLSLKMVPVRCETLGQFTAPNPWDGNRGDKWTVNLYELISETYAPSLKWKQIRREQKQTADPASRRSALQDGKLKMRQTIGFESADGRQHLLPRMLVDLWQAREVADEALPALMKQFESKLKRSDFKMTRLRLIFKVEAIMFLIFGIAALTVFGVNRLAINSAHRQVELSQAEWLARPMSERAISAKGAGVHLDASVRLRSGVVQAPPGLDTYGNLNVMGWFEASNETRLALMGEREVRLRTGAADAKLVLRGVVLPASELGLPPQLLDALAQKIPHLNKNFVFVYNADWRDRDGAFHLGEGAPLLGWASLCLMLPFVAFLISSRFWRRRDERLREEFRSALAQSGVGSTNPDQYSQGLSVPRF